MNNFLKPAEIAESAIESGMKKSTLPLHKMLLLGFLAGAFIALAGEGGNLAAHNIANVGMARLITGLVFPIGLVLIVITGGELFTGNMLVIMSCFDGKSSWKDYGKNLFFVYMSNLAGSVFIAWLVFLSGQYNYSGGGLGGYVIKVAVGKVSLTFSQAFVSGILCNWLVCLAVWLSFAAKDIAGKILAIFLPIWLFVLSGFEHCVANMFYVPAGIIALGNPAYTEAAIKAYNVPEAGIANLTLYGFFVKNLIPVTLGNFLGGTIFVAGAYFLCYRRKPKTKS